MTNFEKLFGTPEKAVHFVKIHAGCDHCSYYHTDECLALPCEEGIEKWLNQEADTCKTNKIF